VLRHLLNPPNWFTSASLFCSTTALAMLLQSGEPSQEAFRTACILVVFGGIFDLLDGRVARLTGRQSDFGVQLDSIADVVGFGVAPALIAYTWALADLGALGLGLTVAYVLAAAFRLARFNVEAVDVSQRWPFPGHGRGLTSTMAGGTLVSVVWVANGCLADVVPFHPIAIGGLVAVLALLMVSSVPYRHFKDLRRNAYARRWLVAGLTTCLVSALVIDPSMWFGAGGVLYVMMGLADGLFVAVHERRTGLRTSMLWDDEWHEESEL